MFRVLTEAEMFYTVAAFLTSNHSFFFCLEIG